MDRPNVVESILTSILQWRVAWLDEQKMNSSPPPICRTQPKPIKITFDNYKDYETTFVPLLMHEIWAQIFEEWSRFVTEDVPMEVDEEPIPTNSVVSKPINSSYHHRGNNPTDPSSRQFWIGVKDYRSEGQYQCNLTCQYVVQSNRLAHHLKQIGEGDLVRLDLSAEEGGDTSLSLFAYVMDVSSERITQYTNLAQSFISIGHQRNSHVINYQVVIAKRPLRLKLSSPMRMSGIYYLKPMIRQLEAVLNLKDSVLASDILSPKHITCRLSLPTIINIKSPFYNDMQFKAIVGANEALVRNMPKIQLIQGPPGTGKTHTLVGIIKYFYQQCTDISKAPKILICTPSNGAIDEVARRLHSEREFLKKSNFRRSLRLVRVGHPDQISETVKSISLEELVETNANFKMETVKKKHMMQTKEIEDELTKCDTEISNLRYSRRHNEIPDLETKIAKLLLKLEEVKSKEEVTAKRETSEASKRNMRYELIKNADVILTTLNSCQRHPLDALFRERPELSFHCVIVDEASQCCEPELLMPLCYRISKMILIGDPMQLPATVISRHAQEFDFGRSMFERFFNHFGRYDPASPIVMLTEQYRMHPDICQFPSKQFYNGRLITASKPVHNYPIQPYIMFDLTHGAESRTGKSLENEVEASFVRNLLTAVLNLAPEDSKIGVITPYKGQRRLITNKILSLKTQRRIEVDVNTCDGFQGQEKDIIILSCVRAFESGTGSVGFLKSFQRVNVALTRAKHSLIVCVSAKSLTKDKTWKALIEDARDRRFYQALTHNPTITAIGHMITKAPEPVGNQTDLYEPELVIPIDID